MISIIVTYYNASWAIGRCLESISLQTYEDYEVIVVDNGSTDRSKMMVDDIMSTTKIKNCQYWKIEHTTTNEAINFGLTMIKGDYVMFMDGFDFLNVNALHYFYWSLITSNADIIIGDFYEASYNTKSRNIKETPKDYNVMILKSAQMIQKMHTPTLHADTRYNRMWNKVIKRSLLDGMKFEEGEGYEITMIRNLVERSSTVAIVPFKLYFKAKFPSKKIDLNVADAYQERIDYLQTHYDIYNEETLKGAQYLLLSNLMDIYMSTTDRTYRDECRPRLVEAYQLYHSIMPVTTRRDFIDRICKKLLTK